MKLKRSAVIILVALISVFLVVSGNSYQHRKTFDRTIRVSSYSDFYQGIRKAMETKTEGLKINIANYSAKTYNVDGVIKDIVAKESTIRSIYGGYSGSISISGKAATISLRFSYKKPLVQNPSNRNAIPVHNKADFNKAIRTALKEGLQHITIKVDKISSDYDVSRINRYITENDPFQGLISSVRTQTIGNIMDIYFDYEVSRAEYLRMRKETEEKANQVYKKIIKPGMKDEEKIRAIHDYIIETTEYDEANLKRNAIPPKAHTPYGVFLEGRAVCDGYAKALKMLLDKCQIESVFVEGKSDGSPHSWNIVKLGTKYYHIDATFNDPISSKGEKHRLSKYVYYLISDARIAVDHSWDTTRYPKCDDDKRITLLEEMLQSYPKVEGYEQMYEIMKDAMKAGKTTVEFYVVDYASFKRACSIMDIISQISRTNRNYRRPTSLVTYTQTITPYNKETMVRLELLY